MDDKLLNKMVESAMINHDLTKFSIKELNEALDIFEYNNNLELKNIIKRELSRREKQEDKKIINKQLFWHKIGIFSSIILSIIPILISILKK